MTQIEAIPGASHGIELRHLRYFVALADAGSFTQAARQLFVAQPTLSQQIRRLEEIVGALLLQRGRDGLRLTRAGTVLLEASRNVLSLVDYEVDRTRHVAGLGRQRLRVVLPPRLPETLAVTTASALRLAAGTAEVDIDWLETPLDAEFSLIRQRQADAGLGWLTVSPDTLPAPLDAMSMGEFEPAVWIPARHPAADRGPISLPELAELDVIYGPRPAEQATYDAWTSVLQAVRPGFRFADPPFLHSLPMALTLAGSADRPTAVLTGPSVVAGTGPGPLRRSRQAATYAMTRVELAGHPLTATAAVVWNAGLPRPLQQILFDTAESIISSAPAEPAALVR